MRCGAARSERQRGESVLSGNQLTRRLAGREVEGASIRRAAENCKEFVAIYRADFSRVWLENKNSIERN